MQPILYERMHKCYKRPIIKEFIKYFIIEESTWKSLWEFKAPFTRCRIHFVSDRFSYRIAFLFTRRHANPKRFPESNHSALKVKRFGSLFISDCFWARVNAWIRYAFAPEPLFATVTLVTLSRGNCFNNRHCCGPVGCTERSVVVWTENESESGIVWTGENFVSDCLWNPKWNESGIVWTGPSNTEKREFPDRKN